MFYKGKRVLVSGGTGLVGTPIVQRLLAEGALVRCVLHQRPQEIIDPRIEYVSADLNNQQDCRAVVQGMQFVFQAAGTVGSAGILPIQAMSSIVTNLVISARMLQAAWSEGAERFLFFGSSTVYPLSSLPLKETDAWIGPPYPGYFGYSWMKRYIEKLGEYVADNSQMKVIVVRPTAVYGRNDLSDHVIPSLIRRALKKQTPYFVWGDGEEVRDFLHATDLAEGALIAMEKCDSSNPVNLGSGKATTIKELVQVILESTFHDSAELVFDTTKPSAIPFRVLDISTAKSIGFVPKVSLEDGIRDTVQWFKEH